MDLEALAVVGLIKLEPLAALALGYSLLRLAKDSFALSALDDGVDDEVREVRTDATGFGPMLDPLELLLLAGILDEERDVVEMVMTGFLTDAVDDELEFDTGDDASLVGIRFTVLVDTALLSEEIELMRLVRELLRFTNRCLLGTAFFWTSAFSTFFIEFTRRGAATGAGVLATPLFPLRYEDVVFRSERLLSSDCWFLVSKVCSWFEALISGRLVVVGVLTIVLGRVSLTADSLLLSSLHEDVVSDGVSDTRLCVSSNPSSLSSWEVILLVGMVRI